MSVCFTHFSILCLTMPWHAPPRHPLGTPHASLAAQHMHSHLFPALGFCLHVLTLIACYFEFVMLCFKFYFWFGTNLNLIKFCVLFCVSAPISLFLVFMCRCLLPNIQLLRDQPQSVHALILIILSLLRQI